MEKVEFFDRMEAEVIRMGGGAKRGVITQAEWEAAQEIRVSIRPTNHIGSTELFTLRKLKPGDYHLMLVAVPRRPTRKTG